MPAAKLHFPPTMSWNGRTLRLLDQTKLPGEETHLDVADLDTLCDAIKRLVVRGAPAIGCAAAYGTVLIARSHAGKKGNALGAAFDADCERLAQARPTAVNLRWAVERCKKVAHAALAAEADAEAIAQKLEAEARAIHDEDREMCAKIGEYGAQLLPKDRATVITHCNAGALATGGSGTALAVMYAAQAAGVRLSVFADETRPLLQGGRLTAWELARAGIDVTVICDNMAASVLRDSKPDAVITGADRIAANGDSANKIGTYGLAILARHHGVPFYIAAPSSTFDLSLKRGADIPIEQRARDEIAQPYGRLSVPDNAGVFNPAFDVTPAELIDALITEKGILHPPYEASIAKAIGRG